MAKFFDVEKGFVGVDSYGDVDAIDPYVTADVVHEVISLKEFDKLADKIKKELVEVRVKFKVAIDKFNNDKAKVLAKYKLTKAKELKASKSVNKGGK